MGYARDAHVASSTRSEIEVRGIRTQHAGIFKASRGLSVPLLSGERNVWRMPDGRWRGQRRQVIEWARQVDSKALRYFLRSSRCGRGDVAENGDCFLHLTGSVSVRDIGWCSSQFAQRALCIRAMSDALGFILAQHFKHER